METRSSGQILLGIIAMITAGAGGCGSSAYSTAADEMNGGGEDGPPIVSDPPVVDDPPIVDHPPVGEGSGSLTLAAQEAKRFRLQGQQNETWVVQSTVPHVDDDVDLYVYDAADQFLASSENGAGGPDNIRVRIPETGDYALDVVNFSTVDSVSCILTVQRLPANLAASSSLNGLYRIVEADGVRVPSGIQEKWLFADGELVSRYVQVDGSLIGQSSDLEAWIDHRYGATTEFHYAGIDFVLTSERAVTFVTGSSVRVELSVSETLSAPGESVDILVESSFDGYVSADGDALEGTAEGTLYLDGSPDWSYELSVRVERE